MYKYIAGFWFGVLVVISLSGVVLPLLISSNQLPVYVIALVVIALFCLMSVGAYYIFNKIEKQNDRNDSSV